MSSKIKYSSTILAPISIGELIDKITILEIKKIYMTGIKLKNINKEDLKIIKGEDKLNSYQFKAKVAKHYFCTMCGIHTHNLRRADPNTYGINVACLDGIDPQEIFKLDVGINDGHNHIMDQKK